MNVKVKCYSDSSIASENFDNELIRVPEIQHGDVFLYGLQADIGLTELFYILPEYFNSHDTDELDWGYVDGFCEEDGLEIKENYDIYTSRRYSQGDVAVIIYEKDPNRNETEFQQYLDNLCWDIPVSIEVEVDDKCLYAADTYFNDWNKGKIIKNILNEIDCSDEELEEIEKELNKVIPEDPSEIPYY